MAKRKMSPVTILSFVTAVFFLILGILGIIPGIEESFFTLRYTLALEVIFGIVEVFAGIILLLSMFTSIDKKLLRTSMYIVLIFWIARIVLSKFAIGFPVSYAGLLNWLLLLFTELIIGTGIYIIIRKIEEK